MTEKKSYGIALIIWLLFGGIGAHRIYIQERASVLLWYWLAVIFTLTIIVWYDLFKMKSLIQEAYINEKARDMVLKN
jgi:TM2 domain-containing membrane protein YozV